MRWEKLTEEEWNSLLEPNRVYNDAELLIQAQINAWASMAIALGCAKDFDMDLSDYVRQYGERFSRSWQIFRGKPAGDVMQWFLFNVESVGFDIYDRELGGDEARARISWLTEGMKKTLELEGLTVEEGALLHGMWIPIAESIDMTFTYKKINDQIIYELRKT